MNQHLICYAFGLEPNTQANREKIAWHAFQSKASTVRCRIQENVKKNARSYNTGRRKVRYLGTLLTHF